MSLFLCLSYPFKERVSFPAGRTRWPGAPGRFVSLLPGLLLEAGCKDTTPSPHQARKNGSFFLARSSPGAAASFKAKRRWATGVGQAPPKTFSRFLRCFSRLQLKRAAKIPPAFPLLQARAQTFFQLELTGCWFGGRGRNRSISGSTPKKRSSFPRFLFSLARLPHPRVGLGVQK